MKKRAIGKTVFLVLLALILLALLGYTAGLLYPRGARAGDNSGLGDWMGRLDGKLRLSEINIPGTHDSATQYIFPAYFLRDQDTGVQEQLENGYRYLDVRVALDKNGEELKLIHAFGTCRRGAALWSKALSYDDFCDAALAFLDAHPGETVIFCVKPESSGDDPAAVRRSPRWTRRGAGSCSAAAMTARWGWTSTGPIRAIQVCWKTRSKRTR